MNAKDEAKLTMFRGVEQYLDTNAAIVSTIAALVTAISDFKAVIVGIINTEQLTNVNLTGITVDKSNSRETLIKLAADIAAVIAAYASKTGNSPLEAEVNYTYTKLKRQRDEQLAPVCQIIYDRANENKTPLKDYGLTDAKIAELQTAIAAYAAKSPNPRTARGSRNTQTAKRSQLFREGMTILNKQIDKIIQNFRTTEPEFYNTYFKLREIPEAPSTATQLKGTITDAATGNPIKGATVTVVQLNKTAVTDSAGEYAFKPIENGRFTVRVTAEGYQPYENDEIMVIMGNIRTLNVSLVNI